MKILEKQETKKVSKSKTEDKDQNLTPDEEAQAESAAKSAGISEKMMPALKATGGFILNALKKQGFDTAAKYLDIALLNQMVDSLADIYKSDIEKYDQEKLKTTLDELEKNPDIQKGKKYKALDSRKDDKHTVDEINQDSLRYWALWFSNDKNNKLTTLIKQFKDQQSKIVEEAKKAQDKLKADISKAGLQNDIKDNDIAKYGTVLIQMFADGATPKQIKDKVEELRTEIKESYQFKLGETVRHNILIESNVISGKKILITEDIKNQYILEALLENTQIVQSTVEWMISEGFLDKAKGLVKKVGATIKASASDLAKKADQKLGISTKIKGGAKQLAKVAGSTAFKGILKGAGIAVSVATLGIGPTVIIKLFDFFETYGKNVRNTIERQFTRFANSKGVIAEMTLSLKTDEASNYSLRYYITDKVWRGINLTDQLKSPQKEFVKELLNGQIGKKFRDRILEQWDFIFGKEEGSNISNFLEIMKSSTKIGLSDNQLKLLTDFNDQYESIKKDCLQSPKIDTRSQKLSTALKK